jgi:hypothetical protein
MFDVLFTFFSTFWFDLWRYKRSERRKSPFSINILMFWFYLWHWKRSLRRKSIFMLFSTFWSSELWSTQKPFLIFWSFWLLTFWWTKKTISTFWNFSPVVVLKFDVPTPSHYKESKDINFKPVYLSVYSSGSQPFWGWGALTNQKQILGALWWPTLIFGSTY